MDFDTKYNLMKEAGRILTAVLSDLKKDLKPGTELRKIDIIAEEMIRSFGAEPAFKNYKAPFAKSPYPYTICLSLNEIIVHGYPREKVYLKDGDVLKVDLGVRYRGVYSDAAFTLTIGEAKEEVERLILTTKQALINAISICLPGNSFGDIGWCIETTIEDQGFKVIKNLCGHDIGEYLHGDLQVLNFGDPGTGRKISPGMFFTIEPMASLYSENAIENEDEYIYKTENGDISTHFEVTLVVLENKNEILTPII
jgi:methionyl aminopeptidase